MSLVVLRAPGAVTSTTEARCDARFCQGANALRRDGRLSCIRTPLGGPVAGACAQCRSSRARLRVETLPRLLRVRRTATVDSSAPSFAHHTLARLPQCGKQSEGFRPSDFCLTWIQPSALAPRMPVIRRSETAASQAARSKSCSRMVVLSGRIAVRARCGRLVLMTITLLAAAGAGAWCNTLSPCAQAAH